MPGEGSVYRRADGKWVAQLEAPGSGRAHRRTMRRIRVRQRDALEALDEMKGDRRTGVRRSRATIGAYLAGWVASVRNIRPATRHGYEVAVSLHLVPELGHIRLADLEPLDVERALSRLSERMSPKHLRNIHGVLRRALNHAVRAGMLARNVAGREYIDAPRVPDREPEAFSEADVAALLAAASGDWLEAPLRLSLGTGLRQGELLGLAWEDVDLEGSRLHIRRELSRREGRYVREELKTGSRSRRVLPLALPLIAALRAHEQRVREAGLVPVATGPVFVTRQGEPLSGSWLTHWLYKVEAAAGVRRLPWKNLRTTFSSRLYEAGVPDRTIADWMGHRRTSTTHGHYIDTAGGSQERALEAVGRLVR